MAELLLKRKKGGNNPPAEVLEMHIKPSLVFTTQHDTDPYLVDLTLFAAGITADEIALSKGARKLLLPFNGRPDLINELLPHLHRILKYAPSITCQGWISCLKWWWRFFDKCQNLRFVRSVADLDSIHYAAYRTDPCHPNTASNFFRIINEAREVLQLPALFWTAISRPSKSSDLVPHEDVARLYTYFQQRSKTILIAYELDELRVPSRQDMHILYVMFLILTGWNPSVVLNIDVNEVNSDGTVACIAPDIQNPLYSVISSAKIRAGRTVQQAHGLNKQRISCINIIKALHRQTSSLRSRLRVELSRLEEQREKISRYEIFVTKQDADSLNVEIAVLRAKIKSPWIYGAKNDTASVLKNADVSGGRDRPIDMAVTHINSLLPAGSKPITESIKLTDFRDAFISYRWQKGGYSWLASMMAAGHTRLASLSAYLNKRQHRQASQLSFVKVTNATWRTVDILPSGSARHLPTIIAAHVKGVAEDRVQRWLAGKDLTIQGVGCLDPSNPPRSVAPNHKSGSVCRPQRCIFCHTHAVLLPDSYIYIARRRAELSYIQAHMSVLAWIESDYPQELSNVESALTLYDAAEVTDQVAFWTEEINAGRHVPMRMEATYA